MRGFVVVAPPLLLRLWHIFGPTKRGIAVFVLAAWRCISMSAQDAVRRRKHEAKEEVSPCLPRTSRGDANSTKKRKYLHICPGRREATQTQRKTGNSPVARPRSSGGGELSSLVCLHHD